MQSYFLTGNKPTQQNYEDLIQSSVNITDDNFTPVNETQVAAQFQAAVIDCSLGKSFFISVREDQLVVDAIQIMDGETYTIIFDQPTDSEYTVILRSSSFIQSTPFVMPAAYGSVSIVTAYAHNGMLYAYPQVDYLP
ncbi:MAG: hypothetical protein FGM16_06810 [Flavobacterium sp.]|nr:hypothetical protein [Flavobacterium sp.]